MSSDPATRPDWPEGYARRILPQVDSTNAEAARIAAEVSGPVWILALRQTDGRGRRGRRWHDPPGNFAATLLLPLEEPAQRAALRSFVAALALFDALAEPSGRDAALALKWPNDVLLNGGKLAGILLEGLERGRLAIGFGVNLRAAPAPAALGEELGAEAPRPVALLPETGVALTPEELLDALAPAYARREAQFAAFGFEPIREAWLERAARLGREITARIGGRETSGRFETVDGQGRLVLSTPTGREALAAAEVFF